MCSGYRKVLCGFALLCMAGLTGCGGSATDPMLSGHIGDFCTVHFRHDALGMGAGAPAPPTSGVINGGEVELGGKLLRANAAWICIGKDKGEYIIPREAILMMEFSSKK